MALYLLNLSCEHNFGHLVSVLRLVCRCPYVCLSRKLVKKHKRKTKSIISALLIVIIIYVLHFLQVMSGFLKIFQSQWDTCNYFAYLSTYYSHTFYVFFHSFSIKKRPFFCVKLHILARIRKLELENFC